MREPAPVMVRTLGPDDIGLMRELLDCFAEAFAEPDTYRSAQPDDAYLRALLAGDWFVAIVAIAEGKVVGGLAGYLLHKFEQERSEFYIYDLGVREEHRRRGIATALLKATKDVAHERGAWVVFVQADSGDLPAESLYARLGVREAVSHYDIPLDPEPR